MVHHSEATFFASCNAAALPGPLIVSLCVVYHPYLYAPAPLTVVAAVWQGSRGPRYDGCMERGRLSQIAGLSPTPLGQAMQIHLDSSQFRLSARLAVLW